MKILNKLLILVLISTLLDSSCTNERTESINKFFDEFDLGAGGSNTKLIIKATFSECGEWGGHNENMEIYAKEDKEFYLDYKKYKVNCDSISMNYGKPSFQKLVLVKSIKLNQINKKAISNYMQRMIKSKIEERYPGETGNLFSVLKSDSTLIIQVYDNKYYDLESYNKLLKELNL